MKKDDMSEKTTLSEKYAKAKAARVGETVECVCGRHFVKKSYQQAFHETGCKDRFWNTVDDKRRARAKFFNS